jgi:hypothetical protein
LQTQHPLHRTGKGNSLAWYRSEPFLTPSWLAWHYHTSISAVQMSDYATGYVSHR